MQVTEIEEGTPEGEDLWSNPDTWAHLEFEDGPRIPQDGDQVTILSTQNITYDIPASEAPKLVSLEINGALNFLPGEARMIRAHYIWVRAGFLNIGSAEVPFEDEAVIELLGDNTQFYIFNFFSCKSQLFMYASIHQQAWLSCLPVMG